MRAQLSLDWNYIPNNKFVDVQWLIFTKHVNSTQVNYVPTKTNPIKEKTRNDLKLDHKIIVKIKKKHKLWKKFIKHGEKDTYINHCRLRNVVRWQTRHDQKEIEKKIAASVKQQPKLFWSYVKSKTRIKSGICDLTYFEDNIALSATTDKRKQKFLLPSFYQCSPMSHQVM